jgi:hypothetical protein
VQLGEEAATLPLIGIPRDIFVVAASATVLMSGFGAAVLDRLRASAAFESSSRRSWVGLAVSIGLWVLFMYLTPQFYEGSLASLWFGAAREYWHPIVLQAAVCLVVITAAAIALGLADRYLANPGVKKALGGAAAIVCAGAVGFAAAYLLMPGYVSAGYLMRRAPMPVFVVDSSIALALYALGAIAWHARRLSLGWVAGLAAVLFGAYWVLLQVANVTVMPPTGMSFLRRLAEPPYRNATFVSNAYGIPIAYFTHSWAYTDLEVGKDRRGADGLFISGKYLWFADRDSNADYTHPKYYLCWLNLDLKTASGGATAEPVERCSTEAIYQHAQSSAPLRLVDQDPTGRDSWAIVELDPSVRLIPTWNGVTEPRL